MDTAPGLLWWSPIQVQKVLDVQWLRYCFGFGHRVRIRWRIFVIKKSVRVSWYSHTTFAFAMVKYYFDDLKCHSSNSDNDIPGLLGQTHMLERCPRTSTHAVNYKVANNQSFAARGATFSRLPTTVKRGFDRLIRTSLFVPRLTI